MKKLIQIVLCICLIGCVSNSVVRGVDKDANIYYSSSNPNIQLQLPTFATYAEGGRGQMKHQFLRNRSAVYVDLVPRPANETQIDYYYNPEKWMFSDVPLSEKINSGTTTILGQKWYYCDSIKKDGRRGFFIRNLGYFAPNHDVLYVRFAKWLTYDEFQIVKNYEYPTNKQNEFIQEIIKEFESDIKFTNYIPEVENTAKR